MEIALSAFLGEIAQRSVSFFIGRLSSKEASPALLPSDEALHCKLLRVRIIVEEAEGRQIKNTAMLEQLKLLQVGMYQGYYMLDNFRYRDYQAHNCNYDHGAVSRHSFALSKFNPAKRVQLRRGSRGHHGGENKLQQVLGSLEVTITDASEFTMFLMGCPPLYRRLYNTYLVLEKTMFGYHVEMECVINFLVRKDSSSAEGLDVLPVVGPAKVGKSTLIEHACADERVRAAFSQIVFLAEDDLGKRIASVSDGGRVKHRSDRSADRDGEVLFIVEVNGDVNEATWSSLYSAFGRFAPNGGKVVICSRSDKIERFGTARALKMGYLTREAFWYFIKAIAFGSANPDEEPKLASMLMEIAEGLNGTFISGNIMASMLRTNLRVRFWRRALSCVKEVSRRYRSMFGARPVSPSLNRKLVKIMNGSNDYCLVFNDYQIVSGQDEAPVITFQEVLSGSVAPHGRFDVVAWRSSIPPHDTYIFSCEIHKAPQLVVPQKRGIFQMFERSAFSRATVDSISV